MNAGALDAPLRSGDREDRKTEDQTPQPGQSLVQAQRQRRPQANEVAARRKPIASDGVRRRRSPITIGTSSRSHKASGAANLIDTRRQRAN